MVNAIHFLVVTLLLIPLLHAEALLSSNYVSAPVFSEKNYCFDLYSESGERCFIFYNGAMVGSTYVLDRQHYCFPIPPGFFDGEITVICGGEYAIHVKRDYSPLLRPLLYVLIVFLSVRFAARLTYYYFRRARRGSL